MFKIIVAVLMWFPFTLPKDTTPKIQYINSYRIEAISNERNKPNIKITKGKSVVSSVKVRIIIPHREVLAKRKKLQKYTHLE